MPAYSIDETRAKRPLTCDICSKPIPEGSQVTVCGRCGRVRHQPCIANPCPKCACEVQRPARFGGKKLLRYL